MEENKVTEVVTISLDHYISMIRKCDKYDAVKDIFMTMARNGDTEYEVYNTLENMIFGTYNWNTIQKKCGYVEPKKEDNHDA